MKQYLSLLKDVANNGYRHPARTDADRISVIGPQMRFDLSKGKLPVVTTRRIYTRAIIRELQWFISGSTNILELVEQKVNIWDPWTLKEKDVDDFVAKWIEDKDLSEPFKNMVLDSNLINTIGPMYGHYWRHTPKVSNHALWPRIDFKDIPSDKLDLYKMQYDEAIYFAKVAEDTRELPSFEKFAVKCYHDTIDQLNELMISLRDRPYSSRHIVTAWHPEYVPFETLSPKENIILGKGALAACHMFFQCFVKPPVDDNSKPRLSMFLYMRSNDLPIGAPYNIAQYSLLTMMIAHVLGYEPDQLIYQMGDAHIYSDQLEQVKQQLTRDPLELPTVQFSQTFTDIFNFDPDKDITINDYKSHDPINYPVAP